jgi:hypothetical protein
MLVSAQQPLQPTVGNRLPRTQSSVLAFALREFLNTPASGGDTMSAHVAAIRKPPPPALRAPATPPHPQQRQPQQSRLPSQPPVQRGQPENAVWVDCFFYGFWIEKTKAAEYKKSVQGPHATEQHPARA